jgi:gliding motility-associated-like protein
MSLKYYPGNNELLLELAKNIAGYKSIVVTLPDRCWHRFTLTRNALVYTFYLNNKKVGTFLPDEQIPMSPSAQMAISGSPCQPVTESPFLGRVDEFNIYKEAVSEAFLRNTNLHPDEIITNDTTIFLGESVDIIFGQTCQSLVSWTPTDGLDDPNSLEPIATPLISTKYKVKTSDSNCASDSEVDIFVVDPDAFDCNDLLLPSAFTPNGDQLNDRFGISNRFIIQKIELFYIMDKWGNKVFETTSASDTWDGTYNGKRLPPGTYTYIINYSCQGSGFNKIGTVVLLS